MFRGRAITGDEGYLEDCIFDLLRFTRFNQLSRLVPNVLQLCLIVCYPPFQRGDVILGVLVAAVKHVAHTDKRIALALQIFEHALFPPECLILEKLTRLVKVPRCRVQALVHQGYVVGVGGVRVLRALGE
jgi:hypothetical protein